MRKDNYTLLIVCEGENTERAYFQNISDLVHNDPIIWTEGINIIVSPLLPSTEKENSTIKNKINHKKKRKQRKLQATRTLAQNEIEDKYKAEPIRFVREAQIGLEDGAYDEAWAVFDYDNRNHVQAAFDLANSGDKKVKIAYSNYSFETWVLMHFEKNSTAFSASECREKKPLNCNTGEHPNDCFGTKCIGGYLRKMNYLSSSTKEANSLYHPLEKRIEQAYHNSAWLRNSNGNSISTKTLQAYTDVDHLVKRLFNKNELINWVELGDDHLISNSLMVRFELNKDKLSVVLTNVDNTIKIIQEEMLSLEDENHHKTIVGKRITIEPKASEMIEVYLSETVSFKYISFQYVNEKVICNISIKAKL